LQDLRYTYDAVGNIARIEDWKAGAPEGVNFSYDDLDRLTNASGVYNESYSYDVIGNLTSKSNVGNYAYNGSQPHAVTSAGSKRNAERRMMNAERTAQHSSFRILHSAFVFSWGITPDLIATWKKDFAWWAIIRAAQLSDYVQGQGRYTGHTG